MWNLQKRERRYEKGDGTRAFGSGILGLVKSKSKLMPLTIVHRNERRSRGCAEGQCIQILEL
jgi:hypothetical protein